MSSENSRTIEVSMSRGQINDAFTSLLLMTGFLHDGEVITGVGIPASKEDIKRVIFTIKKEAGG